MKLNKLIGILVIIFVLIMFVGAVSAADNSNGLNAVGADNKNFEVEHNSVSDTLKASNSEVLGDGNTGNNWYVKAGATGGNGSEAKPYANVNQVINNANYAENDIIYVMDGTYTGSNNRDLSLKENTTIMAYNGAHPIFNAGKETSIFKISSNGVVIKGLTLINGGGTLFQTAQGTNKWCGGAIVNSGDNLLVENCTIRNNDPVTYGGGIYTKGENTEIRYSTFEGCEAPNGGAIAIDGPYAKIINNTFNNNAGAQGGAINIYNYGHALVANNTFTRNRANDGYGGAIYARAGDNYIVNSTFERNSAKSYGGAIITVNPNTKIDNCTFISNQIFNDNSNTNWGGAIYAQGRNTQIVNSRFKDNAVRDNGGAITIRNNNNLVENCTFDNNWAARGGAIYIHNVVSGYDVADAVINNCTFNENGVISEQDGEPNIGTKGGAIYSLGIDTNITNSEFNNNQAMIGGAILYQRGPNFLENNTFSGNKAVRYGGGAISSIRYGDTINNCTFKDNFAKGYGGAVSADYPTITNSTFINNNAYHGGAIYTITANVSNSKFNDNIADDGFVVLAATKLNEKNNSLSGQEAISMNHATYLKMDYDVEKETAVVPGYYAYCVEEFADYPQYGVLWEDLRFVQNSLSEKYVGEYLKILIFKYWDDESQHQNLQQLVNVFTDRDYLKSDNPVVKEVIALYDSGYRVPTTNALMFYENGTIGVFNFGEVVTPSGTQNVFVFNITYNPNLTVEKEVITNPVFVGEKVDFNITVKNTGKCNLSNIWINETGFSDGLVYDTFKSEFNWTYDSENKVWILTDTLDVNKTAYVILTFNVTDSGNMTNNVSTGLSNHTFGNDTVNVTVYKKITINVTKVWNDSDNHDGFRPQNVTFVLYADGNEYARIDLNGTGNVWTGNFTDLPTINSDGKEIVYTVDELPVDNYTKSVVNSSLANYTIMNTYVVNFTSVNVTKVWNDSDDHDGFRPQNVTFVLYADGVENATVVLDDGNNWKGSFGNLSMYKDGKAIVYTVDELSVANYTKSVVNSSLANYTIMNTYVVNFTSVNVTKVWNDSDDHDGFRPQNVTFVLYADGVENATVVLDDGNNWKGSFGNLSMYKDGKAIVYTVDELPVDNYTKSVVNDTLGNYIIMNTYVVNFISVNVTKVWNDSKNHDGFRPQNVTFVLYADGVENATVVLDESNGWKGTFSGLSIYKDGKEIVYTVDELPVDNYTKSVVNDTLGNYIIMNTYVVNFTSVNVTKVWNDSKNHDGFRPQNVTFVLYADGVENATVVLNDGNNWKGSFSGLSIYKDGKEIVYTVDELPVDNYTKSVVNDSLGNYTIMNTYVVNFTSVNVTKVWNDSDDHDGFRPQNVTFVLYADGNEYATVVLDESNNWMGSFSGLSIYKDGKEIVYTIGEVSVDNYTSSVINSSLANYTIMNTRVVNFTSVNVTKVWNDSDDHDGFRPENVTFVLYADGNEYATVVLDESNGWSGSFSGLSIYKDGKEIVYTVDELPVANYTKSVVNDTLGNYIIMNTYVVNFTSVNVTKVWNDSDDHDGFRPQNVTFVLYADGNEYATVVLDESNGWSGSFSGLSIYKDGKEIVYTVDELPVANYTKSVVNDTLGNYIIMNTYVVKFTTVNVTKVWNDNNDQDGVRPADVTVVLVADGNVVANVTLDASNDWSASFNDLPVYKDGKVIKYSVEELAVSNYTSVVSNDTEYNWTVTNSHAPELVNVTVVKVWSDNDNQDGVRPADVTVVLVADGNVVADATLDASNDWSASFNDLPVYKDGKVIKYSVEELAVANYTSVVSNETAYNWIVNNTHVPMVTVINVTKVWDDNNDQDGIRPANIVVELLADGVKVNETTLSESNGWKGSFMNLPVYNDGKSIKYTIDEVKVDNYTSSISEDNGNFVITNAHVPAVSDINVEKIWNDSNNKDSVRPVSIVVELFADGVKVNETTLSEGNDWKYTFKDLPVYNEGKLIKYAVGEVEISNYTANITQIDGGFVITNTHVIANMTVTRSTENKSDETGNTTIITIVVTNNGGTNLEDVYVVQEIPEGFEVRPFENDNWVYDGEKFIYKGVLKPGESVSFDVVFYNKTANKTDNKTYTPGLNVQKITLNDAKLGEITSFKIIVTNIGDCALGDIFVIEQPCDGLDFDSYEGDDWTMQDDTFFFSGVLNPGESSEFTIFFIATKVGELVNTVIAGSNATDNVTAKNTTVVIENKTPDIQQNHTNKTKTVPEIPDKVVKTNVGRATGNPILALLGVLLIAGISSIRRFKK